jgi:hypothetical protein
MINSLSRTSAVIEIFAPYHAQIKINFSRDTEDSAQARPLCAHCGRSRRLARFSKADAVQA